MKISMYITVLDYCDCQTCLVSNTYMLVISRECETIRKASTRLAMNLMRKLILFYFQSSSLHKSGIYSLVILVSYCTLLGILLSSFRVNS